MRSDHQVRLNTVMIPVTVAKIMVPMSGTKIAQDSHSPWFTTARIRNSTETPTMRFARTSSMLWPALATTAAMIAAAPKAADPRRQPCHAGLLAGGGSAGRGLAVRWSSEFE